jgi:hypothetical protein
MFSQKEIQMTKLMKFVAVAMLVVSAQSASAISLRFKFKTFSSGPNIYACNAGIMAPRTDKKVCYFEGTKNACTEDTCSTTGANCNTRCICSSSNGGDWLMNYGKVTYEDWKDNGDASVSHQGTKTFSSNSAVSGWSSALTDSEAWGKRISNLSFNLGSELYGASYFVDVCYRAPQIEYFQDQVVSNFNLKAQANATDFLATGVNGGDNNRDGLTIPGTVDGQKYTDLAGLTVQAFVTCDMQGVGTYKNARNNSNLYNTADNEANFVLNTNGLPTSATEANSSFWNSSSAYLSTGNVALIDTNITNNSFYAPRFCKVRYVFTETDYNSSTPNLRKWQRHGAEMCTWTEINEGLEGILN